MTSSPNTPLAPHKPQSFLENEQEFKGAYGKDVFQVLAWSYRPFMKRCIFWITIGWIGRLMLMGNTMVVGFWIDSLSNRKIPAYFTGWSASHYLNFLTGLCAAGFLLTISFRLSFSRISVKAISSIYDEVTTRVSRYPVRFFDRTPVGRIVTRFSSDYGNMFRMFGGPLSEFFGIIFDLIASMVLLFTAHWLGLAFYFLLLALNLTVYLFNKKKIRYARRDQSHLRSPGVAHFAETVQGASVIRVFGKGETFFKRFTKLDNAFIEAKFRAIRVNTTYAAQMMTSTYGIAFLSGVVGLWLISMQKMSPGELASVMVLLNLAGSGFQMFFDWMAQLEDAFVGVERMNEYLRLPLEPEASLPAGTQFPTGHPKSLPNEEAPKGLRVPAISLEIKNLWFRYGDDLPWILKGVNLRIEKGEKIGIVGRTGAGKTSLFQVLQSFYPHEEGEVLFDGLDLPINVARNTMTVVPQEPVLFNASVRDNLSLGRYFEDGILLKALDKVGLGAWSRRFPDALKEIIEEKGKNLSQGEKQLLVMARMSLIERPLVLMDEATSSIDPQTEEKLVLAMNKIFEGHTQMIIAHRLSTIESCDRVLWLKDGKVELFDKPEIVLRVFQNPLHQDEIGV
ncbi:MAG: ABC transporter ATP-binding protein [Bdellovibrionota bacterium]